MPLVPLRPVLDATVKYGYAQGAFNVNAVAQAEAVIAVHEMFRSPAILQGADLANAFMGGRVDFANGTLEDKKKGARNIAEAVKKFAEQSPIPVVLHLDHGKNFDSCVAAIEGGYTSVMIDGSALPFEENVELTREVVKYAHARGVSVEGAAKRIFATGTPGSTLHQLCLDQGYTFLTFPETIGGRYSVGSDVGLFPMAVAGVDIRALVQGMRDMRDTLLAAPAEENPALRYACLRRLLLEHGYRLEMLSFFEPRLDYFAKWWIQLFAESEGKEGTALYPVAASNSEDLHSIGQFIQEGSPILFETFVEVRARDASVLLPPEAKKDYFDYLTGKDFWDINNTARQATMRAHSDRGIPCLNLSIPAIDAHTLGGLFYFFLFACYLSCKLLGVNPFNQPGVEGYKGYMFQNLGKPGVN